MFEIKGNVLKRKNGSLVVDHPEFGPKSFGAMPDGSEEYKAIKAYADEHPELVKDYDETAEQNAQRVSELTAYLASTDWYAARMVETGIPIPTDVVMKRQAARDEINKLKQ